MLKNAQISQAASKVKRFKGENWSVEGPFFLDDKPYWSIYFTKKTFLKGLRGVTLVVLNEKGEFIKDWRTYRKVAITCLMPKINEKFVDLYLNEFNELIKISTFFRDSQKSIYEFKVDELIEKARTDGADELADCLLSFKTQLAELERQATRILSYMEDTKVLVKTLLTDNRYSTIKNFLERFSSEEKKLKKLRKSISEQAHTIFYMVNLVRELGMRREESKKLIESINKYTSSAQKIEKTLDQMIRTRRFLLRMHLERDSRIKGFYKEMLKRTHQHW